MRKNEPANLVRVCRYLERAAKRQGLSIDNYVSIIIGLDDCAHNRLYTIDLKTGKQRKVKGYGRRRP